MTNIKYNSATIIRTLGISRAALSQAKRKYPQWFKEAGKEGNAVLYHAEGINRWLEYREQKRKLERQGRTK